MQRRKFHILHSVAGITALLIIEAILVFFLSVESLNLSVINLAAIAGGAGIIYVAMEAIEEVRNARKMLFMLSAIVFEFVIFFAFQYYYLDLVSPSAFPQLPLDPISLILHSVMIFVFNPVYPPATFASRALLLVETLESMILVLFLLQNVWQFRSGSSKEIL